MKNIYRVFGVLVFSFISLFLLAGMQATVFAATPGTVDPWVKSPNSLPAQIEKPATVTVNGFIYAIGGSDGICRSEVQISQIANDGSVGAWSNSPNSLPQGLCASSAVTYGGYIYVMGGTVVDAFGATVNVVYYTHVNNDGSIDPWQTSANALPQPRNSYTAVVNNGYIYVMGGSSGATNHDTVYYTHVNNDGSIDPWQTSANALPQPVNRGMSVVSNGYVYVMGGINNDIPALILNTVYYAPLNNDGTVGTWITSPVTLPDNIAGAGAIVQDNYIFIMGGYNVSAGDSSNKVYSAPINSDYSNGIFTQSTNSMIDQLTQFGVVNNNGIVYVVGGYHYISVPPSQYISSEVYYTNVTGAPTLPPTPTPDPSTPTPSTPTTTTQSPSAPNTGAYKQNDILLPIIIIASGILYAIISFYAQKKSI